MKNGSTARSALPIGLTLLSAVLWLCFGVLNKSLLHFTTFSKGIELIYLPAGIRLGLVLIFGIWGTIGICLANPFLIAMNLGEQSIAFVIVNSLIAGFVPYLTLRAVQWLLRIDENLSSLKPMHLPFLAIAASVTAPLAFNSQFIATGLKQHETFLHNLTAMALGDFLGCLVVLIIMRVVIAIIKGVRQRTDVG